MKIFEFISKYCQDLIEDAEIKAKMFDLSDFVHDEVITDIAGNKIPIIYIDGEQVPIADIICTAKEDFLERHKTPGASEAYDNYIGTLQMLEGEEVINQVRNSIAEEQKKLEMYSEFMLTV